MNRLDALMQRTAGQDVEIPALESPTAPFYGAGPADARIVIVCDAPNYEEYEARQVLLGRTGGKVRSHARLAGIDIAKCRVEYVYPFVPLGEKLSNVPPEQVESAQIECLGRLSWSPISNKLYITLGDVALHMLTNLRDSTRRRGSVYEWCGWREWHEGREWRGEKVLAMLDPSVLFGRERARFEKPSRLDWERAKELSTPHTTHHQYCGCANRNVRTHITPFSMDGLSFLDKIFFYVQTAQMPSQVLAIDIETPKVKGKREIVCVSFAFSSFESLVLPFEEYRGAIQRLCNSPCAKVGHNFASFDLWWLKREGIEVGGEIRDTLAMHHALDPASMHSLEFLTSRYTYEPFYKDEAKGHDEHAILKTPEATQKYYEYCGLDSCVTRELHDIFWDMLERRQMEKFYNQHYRRLFAPILDVSSTGVRIDHVARKALLEECLNEARDARDKLGVINGAPLYTVLKNASALVIAKKTVSGPQLKKLLYGTMGVSEQLKRRTDGEYTATADAATLRKLRAEYDTARPEVVEVIDLALAHNKAHKLASFCYDSHFSDDGRFRFTLKVNTEAARLSSSAAPDGTGANSQNSPREKRFRRLFLPEQGQVILDVDLSQVESRQVYAYTGDSELIRLARLRSTEFDQHRFVASLIFKKSLEEVTPAERQLSKSINHGAMRDMQGLRLSETLEKEGHHIVPEACDALIEDYHRAFPAIRKWHQEIRKLLRRNKALTNSWGRIWDVRYEEMTGDLCRRAYSWLPQSECADLMNQLGFIPLWYWLKNEGMKSRIMLHTHDGLVISSPVEEVYDVAQFLCHSLESPRVYGGVELAIPVEYKCGPTWGDGVEYKVLPSRDVMEAAAKELV
jgi:DNA polymerase I-like protein with 3'-5' exonuclease and polymerase domains/uracil-DNA glycosylase